LIDDIEWEEVMGTICGDDTCLIICRTVENAEIIEKRLIQML
ncbi:MAG TPA: arginine repressor, partial [Pseudogracilibacillus sp.]|nr:arginine repressor [Pseudogracilibacillus sp.]